MITSKLLQMRKIEAEYVTIGNRKVVKTINGVNKEYECLREGVMFYDCSTYGLLEVSGDSATDYMDKLATKDIKYLNVGNVCECYFLDENAEVVGSVFILRKADSYIIITPWEQADAVLEWVTKNADEDITITDYQEKKAIVQMEGPYSWKVTKDIFDIDVEALSFRSFTDIDWNNDEAIIARIGRSSEYGYMMISSFENAIELCNQIESREWEFKVIGGGFDAIEIAMLEVHAPNFIRETKEYGNILEMAHQWYVQADKEDYIGYDVLMEKFNNGITKSVVAFTAECDDEIESGRNVYVDEECIGCVVYVKESIKLGKKLGIVCLNKPYAVANITLEADTEKGRVKIDTVSGPVVRPLSWDMKME